MNRPNRSGTFNYALIANEIAVPLQINRGRVGLIVKNIGAGLVKIAFDTDPQLGYPLASGEALPVFNDGGVPQGEMKAVSNVAGMIAIIEVSSGEI